MEISVCNNVAILNWLAQIEVVFKLEQTSQSHLWFNGKVDGWISWFNTLTDEKVQCQADKNTTAKQTVVSLQV